jgi:hypothetical protein
VLVERCQQIGRFFIAVAGEAGEVELGVANGACDPTGHEGQQLGQMRDGERLGVRLPVGIAARHPLKYATGGGHLLAEFP